METESGEFYTYTHTHASDLYIYIYLLCIMYPLVGGNSFLEGGNARFLVLRDDGS